MSSNKMLDTLFLDRDGVLNRKIENGYVTSLSEIEILEGIPEFLLWANTKFKRIVVVTNQRCVGRGIITSAELEQINSRINELTGSEISHFFVCPHLDEDACSCRKPKNGLFLAAAEKLEINLGNSWMVGDSESDLIPAKSLGIKTIFISSKHSSFADMRIDSASELMAIFKYLSFSSDQ